MNNTMQVFDQAQITLIFLPLVIAIFVIGLVFNTLLILLICKARRVNNTTNIYLFSLGITGLMRTFIAFTLIVILAARDWVLGKGICFINLILARLIFGSNALLFLAMSHDRYRAVKYPFASWKLKIYTAIIINIFIWLKSFILGIPGSVLAISIDVPTDNLSWRFCFITNGKLFAMRSPLAFIDIVYIVCVTLSTGLTLIYYVLIKKELRSIVKYRFHCIFQANTINTKDKPIECSVEKRAAKSLASLILFHSVCSITSILLLTIVPVSVLIFDRKTNITELVYGAALFFYLLSAINPFLLVLINKRFRKRIKDLLKWKLVPDDELSTKYKTNTIVPM